MIVPTQEQDAMADSSRTRKRAQPATLGAAGQRTSRRGAMRWTSTAVYSRGRIGPHRTLAQASAERSHRRKSDPFRSAMSMLTFYINRAAITSIPGSVAFSSVRSRNCGAASIVTRHRGDPRRLCLNRQRMFPVCRASSGRLWPDAQTMRFAANGNAVLQPACPGIEHVDLAVIPPDTIAPCRPPTRCPCPDCRRPESAVGHNRSPRRIDDADEPGPLRPPAVVFHPRLVA